MCHEYATEQATTPSRANTSVSLIMNPSKNHAIGCSGKRLTNLSGQLLMALGRLNVDIFRGDKCIVLNER